MNALELEHLQAGYGKVQVLWDISLHVAEGEFVTVVGANGAGKTTTLRTVSSAIRATAGSIKLFGQNITNHSSTEIVRAGLAHVPEGRQLFPLMSIEDNLELGASPRETAWKTRQQTRDRMFKLFPRLEERRKARLFAELGSTMKLPRSGRGKLSLEVIELADMERPPMIRIPEYLERRNELGRQVPSST